MLIMNAASSEQSIAELYQQANDLSRRGEYQKALSCYGHCLMLLEEAADVMGQLAVLHEIVSIYELRNEYDRASAVS